MLLEQQKNGTLIIIKPLERRLDADSSRYFKEKMADIIKQGEGRILLNLSEVQFIDSSGLGALLSLLRQLGEQGNLVLCGIAENVMNLFRLTRLNRVFQIYPDEAQALAAITS
ncbi:MAG: STAS domain-containing protein [Desulfobacca sp.]|uniref:STAS domain-containing protein n=1 Tax=Desulfobacca sp. TaxID=2067990 RepID=UPI0040497CEA